MKPDLIGTLSINNNTCFRGVKERGGKDKRNTLELQLAQKAAG
jgi:hypothetical protein